MSHTATCQRDDHVHVGTEDEPVCGQVSLLGPGSPPVARPRPWGLLALPEVRWATRAMVLFVAGLLSQVARAPFLLAWVLYAGCYVSGGWGPARAGIQALRRRSLDVDLLMVVAALVAAGIGQVLDGALLIVIFATSGALEVVATKRTADSVRDLLTLAPERATRLAGDGREEAVETAELGLADLVLVRPGERVGADGTVIRGSSEVDQATITGEPLPVAKGVGDEVFAGTLNGEGALVVAVTRAAADSVVARIVALVEEASATKAKAQLFVEAVEQSYSMAMVAATLGLFFVPLALGGALQPTLLRAITFMIVASPCAVVLSTMPPLLAAMANAGRHGVLVKSAVVMEQLGQTSAVAFDKTGTLTEGTPRVADVCPLAGTGLDEDGLLVLAGGAERPSEHPLARALVSAATARGLELPPAEGFRSRPGRGVEALVAGRHIQVGSPALLSEPTCLGGHEVTGLVSDLEAAGRTAVVVLADGVPAGVLGLADRLRSGAPATVAELGRLTGRGPVLLTGDNPGAAGRLAEEVGITDVRARLLPQDKVSAVRSLQRVGHLVLVVGDGVNDAPALAAADLGVAMGRHGSDLALETADAVIVGDDLATLPAIVDLSRRARRLVTHNLAFAATAIIALVVLDLTGHLPLPLGVVGHEGSTVVVGLNGLRLLSRSSWRGRRPDLDNAAGGP